RYRNNSISNGDWAETPASITSAVIDSPRPDITAPGDEIQVCARTCGVAAGSVTLLAPWVSWAGSPHHRKRCAAQPMEVLLVPPTNFPVLCRIPTIC
ncbi:unnamed protein product, partial [Laminaria digitata]